MSPERVRMAEVVIRRVAWWYARRAWWFDVGELVQEAWVTVLESGAGDMTGDEHFQAYVGRAVSRRLSRFCWAQSSPLSDPKAGPHLAGVFRAPLSACAELEERDPEMELLKREAEMLVPRLRSQLRERISQIYTEEPGPVMSAVLFVLVDGVKPKEAARKAGSDVRDLYRATECVKRRASRDSTVRSLLADIKERRC
jgi:DNA-directed RNA polymerase specialized sigma24 family protein